MRPACPGGGRTGFHQHLASVLEQCWQEQKQAVHAGKAALRRLNDAMERVDLARSTIAAQQMAESARHSQLLASRLDTLSQTLETFARLDKR